MRARAYVFCLCLVLALPTITKGQVTDQSDLFANAKLQLIDRIDCVQPTDQLNHYQTFPSPDGSRVERILGQPCRILPSMSGSASYLSYRLATGKGLVAGAPYLLEIEYPEDAPRSMVVLNAGCESSRGFHTGATSGDAVSTKYVNSNPEILQMPLAGKYRVWRQLFWLHDRYPSLKYHRGEGLRDLTPADGLPVTIAQYSKENDPASQGIAIREIRLYAVTNPASLQAKVNLPPADLPRRHTLWREEMADGVIASKQSAQRGVDKPLEWFRYKANLMQALAIDTYCKDLLEFGHCQHWDPSGAGGHQWYYYNEDHRKLWDEIVGVMSANGFQVFPYYEYAGSHGEKGLGIEKRAKPLKRDDAFTHISWIEYANADLTDPDTLADFKKLVDQTLGKYAATAKAAGIWIRPRSQLPMGFGENALARFTRETKQAEPVTRTRLIQSKELYQQYRDWWFDKRREFLVAVRDYVREQTKNPQAVVLFTTDASEPGNPFPTWNNYLATDQPDAIGDILRVANSKREKPLAPLAIHEIVKSQMYAQALTSAPLDWGDWEISHANPPADPDRYQEIEGVLLTHGFNRAYTVADAATMQRFTTRSGLAITRHYSLNEHMLFGPKDEELLGYVCTDMEYAGPHCMFAEVQAMAQGDPRYITYLSGATYNRGYPEYVRQFNQAFLALPAIPSEIVTGHSDPDIVVRRYQHPRHGTWWAVINPSYTSKAGFRLPGITTPVRDVITGVETTSIDLLPCQLRTFHQR